MRFSIKEFLEASQGKLIRGDNLSEVFSISTDTRTINSDNIFIPLIGQNFDGHDYVGQAVSKGCRAYLADNKHQVLFDGAEFIIQVEDTLSAYLSIANLARRKNNPLVVGVTGSSGKTTTKELIYSVLSTQYAAHKSMLNYNNEIGLAKTLTEMKENTQCVVIEMGMRGLGEIELLSRYSEPDIAVITNIGTAHIGRLGSIENIAKAKCEITSYLKPTGTLVAYNDERVKKYCCFQGKKLFYPENYKIITQQEDLTEFIYKREVYKIPVSGEFNVINSIAAIEIGLIAGVSVDNIKKGLLNYIPVGDRGKIIRLDNDIQLIVDCYNANPDSVKAVIDFLVNFYQEQKIVLVLGDMAELGAHEEQLHMEIGNFISEKRVNTVITVGEKAKLIAKAINSGINKKSFLTNKEAADYLDKNLKSNSVVLFKSSRCMRLEEIVELLT